MKDEMVKTPITLIGSKSYIKYEPKGTVLIITPWNFPINLTFVSLVNAISAGNSVIIKPSEITNYTSIVIKKIIDKTFNDNEVATVLGAIGTDTRVGRKFLNWGVGYGGPCLPRDNRAFAAFAQHLGMKHNLGHTTDEINNEHALFMCEYWESINYDKVAFYFDYISYKKGTDILEESQQFRLCTNLLDKGYKVYIHDNKLITDQVYDKMLKKYGDKVNFVDDRDNITEPICMVTL